MRFILASASPARLATLRSAGLDPEVAVSGVDESRVSAGSVEGTVRELAELKATAVSARIDGTALVLGCDSLLEMHGVALGKPTSPAEAIARWQQLRGRSGVLHTGHALVQVRAGRLSARVTATGSTGVRFANPTEAEIEAYVETGEPLSVAGAFTIDGKGGWFVESIDGDPSNVVGVSLPLLRGMLAQLGVRLIDIGYGSTAAQLQVH
jgi:nucleoside triphosphate pyrophosphatase